MSADIIIFQCCLGKHPFRFEEGPNPDYWPGNGLMACPPCADREIKLINAQEKYYDWYCSQADQDA